jgi:hypothetical protein
MDGAAAAARSGGDVLVWPELISGSGDRSENEAKICSLADELGCHIVGG